MKKKAAYFIPVLAGILFCFYYLHLAAANVAFSDYVRLINAYLPDVGNPAKFFVPDILTRVPLTYLGRLVNVKLFGYNTLFDMGLGVLSLGIGAAAVAGYGEREAKVSYPWFLLVMFLYFSLNKWEMLTNGTGWVCFLSVSGFYCHYLVLDHAVRTNHVSGRDRLLLLILPPVLTLLVAGPYCGSYSGLLLLVYTVMIIADYKKNHRVNRLYLSYLAAVLIPLLLYLVSNANAVYVHRGAVEDGNLIGAFFSNPAFFIRFLLKALASTVLGSVQTEAFKAEGAFLGRNAAQYLLGALVMCLYLYALYLTWRHRIYEKTVFPLLLILNGGINHLLILSARWIFLKESYGMSSRYAIQYQMGIIGILLTFAIAGRICAERKKESEDSKYGGRAAGRASQNGREGHGVRTAVICLGAAVILAGNAYTTKEELKTAPFRKAYLDISRGIALNYRDASDEDLETYLQHDADEVRKAMKILEDNNLNLFRK